jgi:hypothetical protein
LKEHLLPEDWKVEIHDKNLLRAVSDHGLQYLGKLKDNREYEFGGFNISRRVLLSRVETLCNKFKNYLPKFKK